MNQASPAPRVAQIQFSAGLKWFSALMVLTLLLVAVAARAQPADDQYLNIISIVDRADVMNEKKQGDLGKAKYLEAATALQNLRKQYPAWNVKVLSYRLNYVSEKITALSQTNSVVATDTDKPGAKTETKAASGAGQVKLLTAGAEPRKALRIQAKVGDKQSLSVSLKKSVDAGPLGVTKSPEVKIPLELTVKSVSADGDITYETVVGDVVVADDAGGSPLPGTKAKAEYAGLSGQSSTTTISNRGLNKTPKGKIPANTDFKTRAAMQEMQDVQNMFELVLPEEAVGRDARWELKQPIKVMDMTIQQTMTFQLVSVEGDRLELKVSVAQSATNQKMEIPGVPMKLDLTKMIGTITGKLTFDLAQIQPSQATGDSHVEVTAMINQGGQKLPVSLKFDDHTNLESK